MVAGALGPSAAVAEFAVTVVGMAYALCHRAAPAA
jgi:hypothetical protein